MAIAYAQQKQILTTVRADTSLHLRTDLDTVLASVGWTNKIAVTDGFKYTIQSPQALFCKVLIHDNGARRGAALSIQFMSLDETLLGQELHLDFGTYAEYQIIAGYCQFFISLPANVDHTLTKFATDVCGGIPRLPEGTTPDCTAETAGAVSQIFWCNGSGDEAFGAVNNFRNALFCNTYFSFLLNLTVNTGFSAAWPDGPLQLYSLFPTYNIDSGGTPEICQFVTRRGLDLDALIGWQITVQGQLWDAFIRTGNSVITDEIITTTEVDNDGNLFVVTWKAWSFTLFLRIDEPNPATDDGWNYAY